jgi:hypothetical protein
MAQQKGMKRAKKVADRNRKQTVKKKAANIRRAERQTEVAAKESK